MTDPCVVAEKLTKRFDAFVAVNGIDLAIEPGIVFGFLGPNGAGKTSTMRMIACASPITDGELRVLGRSVRDDPREIKRRLGIVPQDDNLEGELSVDDNLFLYARYFNILPKAARPVIDRLLDFAQLKDRRSSLVQTLSGGMKRRLLVARALVSDPELVILDEPTTGLDPQSRHLLWDRLRELRAQGRTQILTTHYMDEAERLCDRLVIMDRGNILTEGTPRALIESNLERDTVEFSAAPDELQRARAHFADLSPEQHGGRLCFWVRDGDALRRALSPFDGDAMVRRTGLEDVFLRLTGRSLNEE